MAKRLFGTDGIRGRVGQYPITADSMLKLGWAAGRVLSAKGQKKQVLIGKDTRLSGYMFESALEAGLSAAGADAVLLGPMPTPAVAYLTRAVGACAGIVISASHNPHYDNGIKFFSAQGEKLDDATERAIEEEFDRSLTTVESPDLGRASRLADARSRYVEFCKGTIGKRGLQGLNIVLDCANGATYQVAPSVFTALGAEVQTTGVLPDGININVDSGSQYPATLQRLCRECAGAVGIAFDGDGDRVIMVDEQGEVVDGDELLFVIACDRLRRGSLRGPVVGTLMSNYGLEVAFRELGVDFHRARVGDRYVMETLRTHGGVIGGESSGHIICLDRTSTGDGIISALQVLEIMVQSERGLHELKRGMSKLPQRMINVPITIGGMVSTLPAVKTAVAEVEAELGADGRVLLRPSGTEPVVRVMVEGVDAAQVARLAEQLARVVAGAGSPQLAVSN